MRWGQNSQSGQREGTLLPASASVPGTLAGGAQRGRRVEQRWSKTPTPSQHAHSPAGPREAEGHFGMGPWGLSVTQQAYYCGVGVSQGHPGGPCAGGRALCRTHTHLPTLSLPHASRLGNHTWASALRPHPKPVLRVPGQGAPTQFYFPLSILTMFTHGIPAAGQAWWPGGGQGARAGPRCAGWAWASCGREGLAPRAGRSRPLPAPGHCSQPAAPPPPRPQGPQSLRVCLCFAPSARLPSSRRH